MSLVTWSEALSVGIPSIDAQHQKLVALLNDLYDAVVALRGQNELAVALSAMVAYSREHFSFEEKWMARCAYPEMKVHQAAHHQFAEFAVLSDKKLRGGEFVSSAELVGYLRDWLTHHIMEVDRKYGDCLKAVEPGLAAESAQ